MLWKRLLRSTVALHPEHLGSDTQGPTTETAIEWALERQYLDRVIHGQGLVLAVISIESVGEGRIFHSDGHVYFDVVWSGLVFCPEAGEVLTLRVQSQSEEGILLSSEFFEDFYIPKKNMKSGEEEETRWDAADRRWVYVRHNHEDPSTDSDEDEDGHEEEFAFENGQEIYAAVFDVQFKSGYDLKSDLTRFSVCCKIDAPGLGMIASA